MPDKSNKLNIKSKGNINTDNTKNNKFTSEQLFAMISQCQYINNNKTYRTISESDIFSNERSRIIPTLIPANFLAERSRNQYRTRPVMP